MPAMKKKLLTDISGEVKELTSRDIRNMRPAIKVLPAALLSILPQCKAGHRNARKESIN